MKCIARTLAVLVVAPLLVGAADPRGDLRVCDGTGASPATAPDLVGVAAVADELGTVALWRLRFAAPLQIPGPGQPVRIEILVKDPRIAAWTVDGFRGVNRVVSWDAVSPDEPIQIHLVPERSTTPFNPPVIHGATVEIQAPGRMLLGEREDGTEDVGRARWTLVVRDAGSCDYVGGGAPTLRLRRLQGGPGTVVPSPATLSNPSLSAASASTVSGWSRAMLGVAAVVFVMLGVAWWVRRRRNPDRALNPVAAQPKPRSAMPETEEIRWIAFRDVAGAAPGALSTALPIGLGWRGKHLRLGDPVDVFDRYVEDVAKRVGAAFGVWHLGPFAYGIAAARDTESTRFLLDGDPDDAPEAAADAVARCAVGTSPARWYQVTSQALSEWSTRAPRTVDPLECLAVLEMRGGNAAAAWCELLGMAVPIPREGAPGDKVSETRAALTHAAERRRQRRQSDLTW